MRIQCLKGNRTLDLVKNRVYPVIDIFQLGPSFGHEVRILLMTERGHRSFYVPMVHKNRLNESDGFNVNRGDPTQKARVKFINFDPTKVRTGGE